jgi:hypothetical protein
MRSFDNLQTSLNRLRSLSIRSCTDKVAHRMLLLWASRESKPRELNPAICHLLFIQHLRHASRNYELCHSLEHGKIYREIA